MAYSPRARRFSNSVMVGAVAKRNSQPVATDMSFSSGIQLWASSLADCWGTIPTVTVPSTGQAACSADANRVAHSARK